MENSQFTYHYHQPEEYRFSLDSVMLAKYAAEQFRDHAKLAELKFLDLCAGTGVIGFELYFYLKQIEQMDFLEVQNVYLDYFLKNKEMIAPLKNRFNFLNLNYETLIHDSSFHHKYDVILCNPPYFFEGKGLLSPSEFKNRCRFFLDSSFENLFIAIFHALNKNGKAYVLVRDGKEHKRNPIEEVRDILKKLDSPFELTEAPAIRGVLVFEILKL